MGKKSAENLVREIEKSKTTPFERVTYALGVRFVGGRTAELLAEAFTDMEHLQGASKEELESVFEVGPKVADAIRQFFDQEQNKALIARLAAAGVNRKASPSRARAKGPFTGKTIVVTGTIEGLSRDEIKTMLRRQGARVVESISNKTDILVCGKDAGAKLLKARALGVRVMETEEFRELGGASK